MGAAASANIHPGESGMFEPIHGSAPKYAGKNVANPVAAVASVQLLLDFLGEKKAGAAVENAIATNLQSRKIPALTANCGLSTSQIGDLLAAAVRG
jgi:3-isopropylmalate dehydrogenase